MNANGFPTIVVNDQNYYNYPGSSFEEKIRNWLMQNYQSENIGYVLLIGDPRDPDPLVHGDVLTAYRLGALRVNYASITIDPPENYSDHWYADLDPNSDWDMDGDGFPGEFCGDYYLAPECQSDNYLRPLNSGVHLVPDVFVGRLPIYQNTVAAQNVLRDYLIKAVWFISQENSGSWRTNTLVAGDLFRYYDERRDGECATACLDKTDNSVLGELIKDNYLDPRGHTTMRLYERGEAGYVGTYYYDYAQCPNAPNEYTRTYCENLGNTNLTADNFMAQIRNNDYGLVLWFAHGGADGPSRYLWHDESPIDGLPSRENCTSREIDRGNGFRFVNHALVVDPSYPTKNRRFFAFMGSCSNNAWSHGASFAAANIAETVLAKYAIASIASTAEVWLCSNKTFDSNGFMMQGISYRFSNKISTYLLGRKTVGQAFFEAKSPLSEYTGVQSKAEFGNIIHYTLLGDPRLKLKNNM